MDNSSKLAGFLEKAILWLGIGFVFVFPLYVLPVTTEFSEYNKLYLTIIVSLVMLVMWLVRSVIQKKVVLAKTPLDVVFVLFLISFGLSTMYSISRYNSLFGSFNSWHWTVVELFASLSFFYVILSTLKERIVVKLMVGALVASIFVVALVGILGYFNVFDVIFKDSTNIFLASLTIDGFSLAGSVNSTIVLLLVGLFFSVTFLVDSLKTKKVMIAATYGLVVGAVGFALILWLGHYVPGISPRGMSPEQLSFSTSWRIATSAIRDYPWFGTGLSSYSSAYNAYRPVGINQTAEWNLIFDRSGSEYMTILTTAGVIGFAVFMLVAVRLLLIARRSSMASKSLEAPRDDFLRIKSSAILGVLSIVIIYLFTSSTVLTSVVLFILLTIWMACEKLSSVNVLEVEDVELSFAAIKGSKIRQVGEGQILPWVVGVPIAIIASIILFFTVQDVRSNIAFASSLRMINENAPAAEIYNAQSKAINLNGFRDAYHRGYADTNLAFANAIAQSQGENLTDTDRTDIATLIDEAIRQVRIITEILDAVSAANWQVRANVYRSLLGIATGADQWSLQAYENAINLAPNDPRLYVDLGGLYLTLAMSTTQTDGTSGEAPSGDVSTPPTTKQDNLARSEAALLRAINLKSDYANAHYNLAAVYNAAERYDLAKTELETTLRLLDPSTEDYGQTQKDLDQINAQIEATVTPTPE